MPVPGPGQAPDSDRRRGNRRACARSYGPRLVRLRSLARVAGPSELDEKCRELRSCARSPASLGVFAVANGPAIGAVARDDHAVAAREAPSAQKAWHLSVRPYVEFEPPVLELDQPLHGS